MNEHVITDIKNKYKEYVPYINNSIIDSIFSEIFDSCKEEYNEIFVTIIKRSIVDIYNNLNMDIKLLYSRYIYEIYEYVKNYNYSILLDFSKDEILKLIELEENLGLYYIKKGDNTNAVLQYINSLIQKLFLTVYAETLNNEDIVRVLSMILRMFECGVLQKEPEFNTHVFIETERTKSSKCSRILTNLESKINNISGLGPKVSDVPDVSDVPYILKSSRSTSRKKTIRTSKRTSKRKLHKRTSKKKKRKL